jgi:DNA-binding NtrC family response regulator
MNTTSKILIIDDNKQILESLSLFLGRHFKNIYTERNPNNIHNNIYEYDVDIVVLDMNFMPGTQTGNEGLFWLKEITKKYVDVVVILITAYGEMDLAVEGMKLGAFDFILKPWDNKKLLSSIQAACKYANSKNEVKKLKLKNDSLIEESKREECLIQFKSASMQSVAKTIEKVAATDANILLLGENGTGKDVLAHLIHESSNRKNELILTLDLTALSETLFESELFGAEKGSFTGANELKIGKFEAVHGGTLFLDEIGNLPIHLQAKMLTILQNKRVMRLGSSKQIPVDFRLISATNKNLNQLIKNELFREDLLYRLNTVQIEIPPLRNRVEDILPLAQMFLSNYSVKYGKHNLKLTESAIKKLEIYNWPGNIRELKHSIEKAVILAEDNLIKGTDFLFAKNENIEDVSDVFNLSEIEKITIQKAINKSKGNMSHAAQMLGISRNTLYAKVSKYGL